MDGAAYHNEQLMLQREIIETLEKSLREPLTADDARLLSWACGVTISLNHDRNRHESRRDDRKQVSEEGRLGL